MEYKKVSTTQEVYSAMRMAYSDMSVFSSYSAPDGDYYLGNSDKCVMLTEWGFNASPIPILGAKTTWDKDPEGGYKRINETHTYWLCIPIPEDKP